MTYFQMKKDEQRSLANRITYLLRMNDNFIDEEIQKLMDEYKAKTDEVNAAYAEENRYGL